MPENQAYVSEEAGLGTVAALHDIFSQTSDAVFAIDDASSIVYENNAFAKMFPRQAPEMPRRCYEVVCGHTLDGRSFCRPDCPIGKSLLRERSVQNLDLLVPRTKGGFLRINIGGFPASQVFDKAAAIFMLRPSGPLNVHFGPTERKESRDGSPSEIGPKLTGREKQILALLAKGLSTKALAGVLHISYVTARNHIQHIYEKLDVHSRAEAVSYVHHNGYRVNVRTNPS